MPHTTREISLRAILKRESKKRPFRMTGLRGDFSSMRMTCAQTRLNSGFRAAATANTGLPALTRISEKRFRIRNNGLRRSRSASLPLPMTNNSLCFGGQQAHIYPRIHGTSHVGIHPHSRKRRRTTYSPKHSGKSSQKNAVATFRLPSKDLWCLSGKSQKTRMTLSFSHEFTDLQTRSGRCSQRKKSSDGSTRSRHQFTTLSHSICYHGHFRPRFSTTDGENSEKSGSCAIALRKTDTPSRAYFLCLHTIAQVLY